MSITCSPFDCMIALVLSSFIMINGAVTMFKITHYYKANGEAPLTSFLEELRSSHSKDSIIQYRQIMHSITMLETARTRLGERHTKHLEDGIWELRPGCNRVLFFFFRDDTFILLHAFRKESGKAPRSEIRKAKAERADWISRNP